MGSLRLLSLYRRVLRLHRSKLPDVHRAVGDRYVRQEFRAHLDVKPEQEEEFLVQWEDYASHLSLEADLFGIGRDLPDAEIEAMSEDQQVQLQKLRDSAVSIGVQAKTDAGQNPYDEKSRDGHADNLDETWDCVFSCVLK